MSANDGSPSSSFSKMSTIFFCRRKGPHCPEVGRKSSEKTKETTENTIITEENPTNKNLENNYVVIIFFIDGGEVAQV
jgi:hypothetical protein